MSGTNDPLPAGFSLPFLAKFVSLLKASFHDPCYLGRQNGVTQAPGDVLKMAGLTLTGMQRHAARSFSCEAGGTQMLKEEQQGTDRLSETRLEDAEAAGAEILVVGCPFCLAMLNDAAKTDGKKMIIYENKRDYGEGIEMSISG